MYILLVYMVLLIKHLMCVGKCNYLFKHNTTFITVLRMSPFKGRSLTHRIHERLINRYLLLLITVILKNCNFTFSMSIVLYTFIPSKKNIYFCYSRYF